MNNNPISISKHALDQVIQRFHFKERGCALTQKIINEIKNGQRLSIKELVKRKIKIGSPRNWILFENRIYIVSEDNNVITAFLDEKKP